MKEEFLGYDKNGEYSVITGLTHHCLYKSVHTKSLFAPSFGYYMAKHDVKTGKVVGRFYATITEAVQLAMFHGVRNAYITARTRKNSKDEVGNPSLKPMKFAGKEVPRYFSDGVHFAFEIDSEGRVKRPKKANIKKEECTEELWKLISNMVENDKYARNTRKKVNDTKQKERNEKTKLKILSSSKFKPVVPNFDEK